MTRSMIMPEHRNHHNSIRRGFTLMEMVVAIAIFLLVIGLLGFPLYTAFGYIQKALAQGDAQSAGNKAIQQLRTELALADEVADIPPTGDWITILYAKSTSINGSVLASANDKVRLVRFSRTLDFPWTWDGNAKEWKLLEPDYYAGNENRLFSHNHLPFYLPNDGRSYNPFVLTRYEEDDIAYSAAKSRIEDDLYGNYPLSDPEQYPVNIADAGWNSLRYRDVLRKKTHTDLAAITPNGDGWDVSRFQAIPMRILKESLKRSVVGNAIPTVMAAKYPLWAARNRDMDLLPDSTLENTYHQTVANLKQVLTDDYGLYRLGEENNPFGFQVQVFDGQGGIQYGYESEDSYHVNRHFMDWPPIDREDLVAYAAYTSSVWSLADIRRQRDQGKLVFEQPINVAAAIGNGYTDYKLLPAAGSNYYLPAPLTWSDSDKTYLVQPPQRITVGGKTFTLVDSDTPGTEQFCLVNRVKGLERGRRHGKLYETTDAGWQLASREIKLGSAPGGVTITDAVYTICDLQPDDVVVATYCTRGMLDVGFTLSRQDKSGAHLEDSRQNYTFNMRIEARNAMQRARSSE